MDNHVHILIKCDDINVLSKRLHKVNTCYALYYNKMYNRVGYVFRDRYRAEPIYDYAHLVTCIKYIHNNPLKAGIVDDLNNYPFSSYNDYMKDRVEKDIIVEVFGNDPTYKDKIAGNVDGCDFIEVDNEFGISKLEDFNEVCNDYKGLNFKDSYVVSQVSNQLRKRCGVEHSRIYRFMGISKTTYFEKIKIGLLRDVPESGKKSDFWGTSPSPERN